EVKLFFSSSPLHLTFTSMRHIHPTKLRMPPFALNPISKSNQYHCNHQQPLSNDKSTRIRAKKSPTQRFIILKHFFKLQFSYSTDNSTSKSRKPIKYPIIHRKSNITIPTARIPT